MGHQVQRRLGKGEPVNTLTGSDYSELQARRQRINQRGTSLGYKARMARNAGQITQEQYSTLLDPVGKAKGLIRVPTAVQGRLTYNMTEWRDIFRQADSLLDQADGAITAALAAGPAPIPAPVSILPPVPGTAPAPAPARSTAMPLPSPGATPRPVPAVRNGSAEEVTEIPPSSVEVLPAAGRSTAITAAAPGDGVPSWAWLIGGVLVIYTFFGRGRR